MKKALRTFAVAATISLGAITNAHAGIPVIDGANLAQSIQQVLAWAQQYSQMATQIANQVKQYTQLVQTFQSMNGSRMLGMLGFDTNLQNVMPKEFGQIMQLAQQGQQVAGQFQALSGKINDFKSAANLVDFSAQGLDIASDIGQLLDSRQTQIAIDRVLGEETLSAAGQRTENIETLANKINDTSEQKDVLDLTARIAAESANIQNEQVKYFQLAELRKTQEKIEDLKIHAMQIAIIKRKAAAW